MAVVKCIDCGNDVSDRAVACPKCGGPIRREPTLQPPAASVQTTTMALSRRKLSFVTAGFFLLIALAVMGAIIRAIVGSSGSLDSKDESFRVRATTPPRQTNLVHPDALLFSDAEKKYFGAAGAYLKTVHEQDFRLATVMGGAQTGESTLGDINGVIRGARSVEETSYFGDYKSAAVLSGCGALDRKIQRCKRLHDSAFEELLAYWRDSNLAHIESGNATLRQAVIATNECVSALNAKMDALKRERQSKTKAK